MSGTHSDQNQNPGTEVQEMMFGKSSPKDPHAPFSLRTMEMQSQVILNLRTPKAVLESNLQVKILEDLSLCVSA